MKDELNKIPVIVYLSDGTSDKGLLEYSKTGPSIQLHNGKSIENSEGVAFRPHESVKLPSKQLQIITSVLDKEDIIMLDPICCRILGYSEEPSNQIKMYPPSSGGWISHVVDSGERAIYTIQKLVNRERFLLTISNPEEYRLLGSFLLHCYEIEILRMKRDWDVHREVFQDQTPPLDMEKYLNKAPPSWSFISDLSDGVTIPNLRIMKTMGDTMSQLVPRSFPPDIRNQLVAFLSWLETAEIPNQDPIEIHSRYASVDTFRSLVWGHLMCLLEGVDPPRYVRIFTMADKGRLSLTERPLTEPELQNPWYNAREELYSLYPDRMKRALKFAQTLNDSDQIVNKLPVSREEALSSRESWGNRFAMIIQGLMMRGHVVKECLGLKTMVYVGGAHRWPHPHIEFSARLGYQTEKPQHIQIMVLPVTAVEKVTRMLPTIVPIDWEHTVTNLSLYSEEKREWMMKSSLIEKSLERSKSFSQLKKQFINRPIGKQISLSPSQAKVLDIVSWGLYLSSLETGQYSNYFGVDLPEIESNILSLKTHGALLLEYTLILRKLTSVYIYATGASRKIYSFCRAMLKHTPSTSVRISENRNSCYLLARIPEDKAYTFITKMPSIGQENGITIKVLPISAYISYRNNLYQRLLRKDGTWNDDVSGLLSQVRLRTKYDG